jgi:hypothetical protein
MYEHGAEKVSTRTEPEDGCGFVLNDRSTTVYVKRTETRNGVRLEVRSPRLQRSIRLDPVALESLTWQTPEGLAAILETGEMNANEPEQAGAAPPLEGPEEVALINEFSTVHVRRADTPDGPRLEVSSPRLHSSIRLDPATLEALACQTMETFSTFLETPLGHDSD